MPDNSANSNQQTQDTPKLPLQAFFNSLKVNGFLVTPDQIADANQVISKYASAVKDEKELVHYLSTIFARNEDEQLQFEEIFQSTISSGKTGSKPTSPIKKHFKKHWWKYTVAIVIAIILIGVVPPSSPKLRPKPDISLYDAYEYEKADSGKLPFQQSINEKLSVYITSDVDEKKKEIRFQTKFNWGDGTNVDTLHTHSYQKPGQFKLTAFVDVFYKNHFQYSDTVSRIANVCSANNHIIISKPGDSLRIKEKVKFEANIIGPQPDSIRWQSDEKILGYGKELATSFVQEGQQSLYCFAIYDSLNSPCTVRDSANLTVYDPDKPSLRISILKSANARAISLTNTVRPFWFYLSGSLGLLSFVLCMFFAMRNSKQKRKREEEKGKTEENYENLLKSFAGKKVPGELPFQNKNYLPVPEPAISEAATQMRRRINDEAIYLQIQKTIEQTISNWGFFEPVYVPRLQQSEFLVLIDSSHNNNQQVKLFDYLVEILKKQNVFIEKYYYRYEPSLCYSATEPNGISLEKLSEKYDKHILLIFGNAYQLLHAFYPVFNNEYGSILSRWQNKAIITPVSFLDWSTKEMNALLPQLPIIPVDVEGQLMLMDVLFTKEYDILNALRQYRKSFYPVTPVNFEEAGELHRYCNEVSWSVIDEGEKKENILFQWIAALAVYPKIKWEITLSIGKRILDRYNKTGELNFTNLLRIARIQWMKDGQFPDQVRLDLLKNLTVENEIIARETILSLLSEIPDSEMNIAHFAYEEKEVQRITNEFILYAYDPLRYEAYKSSEEVFKRFLEKKKLIDAASLMYLKNENAEWPTLINKGLDEGKKNVPVDEYFDTSKMEPRQNTSLRWAKAFAVIFLLSFLGLIFFFGIQVLHTGKFPLFTYRPPVMKGVSFNTLNNAGISSDRIRFNVGNSTGIAASGSPSTVVLIIDDSSQNFSMTFDGTGIFDTAMQFNYDAYDINVGIDSVAKEKIPVTIYMKDPSAIALANIIAKTLPANFSVSIQQSSFNDTAIASVYALSQYSSEAYFVARAIGSSVNRTIEPKLVQSSSQLPVADSLQPQSRRDVLSHVSILINQAIACTPVSITSLPQSLNEIWHGGTSNRLLTINLFKRVLYYSVNDVYTYGTYGIDEICLTQKGAYKIITKTDKGYKLFFIRNTTARSFELSVCQDFVSSKAELAGKDESYCDRFNTMTWYYEKDPEKIFLPVNGIVLASSERIKISRVVDSIEAIYAKGKYVEHQFSNFNPVLSQQQLNKVFANTSLSAENALSKNRLSLQRAAHPFMRSYCTVTITLPSKSDSLINQSQPSKKGTVICNVDKLNVRSAPSPSAPVVGTITRGTQLDFVDEVRGENLMGISLWYQDAAGKYYWSGGFGRTAGVRTPACDTVHSYIGGGKGNIFYKGRSYLNIPLKEKGIELSLAERNSKYGVFKISINNCKEQVFTVYVGKQMNITLCDGTVVSFTLLDWQNKTGNPLNKEAIFDVVICRPQPVKG